MNTELSPKSEQSLDSYSVVLFDGVCKFCNGWVQFIIRHDHRDRFRFSPLQSDMGQSLLASHRELDDSLDSVIVLEDDKLFTHSSAVLQILRRLGGLWSLLVVFRIIPSPLRDMLYRWIAKRRYKLFGKYDSCMIPNEQIRRKFIG
jgi:predicted DCC family thiol-disulfide oxidoreductase YuxK